MTSLNSMWVDNDLVAFVCILALSLNFMITCKVFTDRVSLCAVIKSEELTPSVKKLFTLFGSLLLEYNITTKSR